MRLASVRTSTGVAIGLPDPGRGTIVILPSGLGTVDDVVRGDVSRSDLQAAAGSAAEMPLSEVDLAAPLQRHNRDILCTGWNYLDHFYESAGRRQGQEPEKLPDRPTFFSRAPGSVVGPRDAIAFDAALSEQWDYEAELAVIIGRDGRSISEADVLDHVFGYAIANDVSLRDVQRAHGGQWLKGKSVDHTMPFGPWITTADEVPDPQSLMIDCILNDVVVQHASTAEMAFSVRRLIAELSLGMTLRTGDVVLTGTPSGIGNARTPPLFLAPGDRLITRIEGLGELDNRVTAMSLALPG